MSASPGGCSPHVLLRLSHVTLQEKAAKLSSTSALVTRVMTAQGGSPPVKFCAKCRCGARRLLEHGITALLRNVLGFLHLTLEFPLLVVKFYQFITPISFR